MSFLDSFNKFTNDINNKLNGELQKTGLGGISYNGQDGTDGLGVSGLGAINSDKSQEIDMGGELGNLGPKYGFTPDMVFDEQGHFKHKQNTSGNGVAGENVGVGEMGHMGHVEQTFENPVNPSGNFENYQNTELNPQSGVNLKKSNPVTPMNPDNSQIQNNGDTFDDWYNQ